MAQLAQTATATVEPLQSFMIANLATSTAVGTAPSEPLPTFNVAGLPNVLNTGTAPSELLPLMAINGILSTYGLGNYTITGTVLNSNSQPVARTVIAYDRITNIPIDITVSNPVTGTFTLHVNNLLYYVVCLPSGVDGTNAQIYDIITPIAPV